jgi:hypothetical protein
VQCMQINIIFQRVVSFYSLGCIVYVKIKDPLDSPIISNAPNSADLS